DEKAREQAVPAALLRFLPAERVHVAPRLVPAPIVEHRRKPLDVALIDRELAGPLGRQEIGPAPGRLARLHLARVEADDALAHIDGRPPAFGIDRARRIAA